MKRYFYYLILLNMLNTVFLQSPKMLIDERFEGAVLAIPLGIIIGTLFLLVFTFSIQKFPGLGISEILKTIPAWLSKLFLIFFAIMWFLAGAGSLLSFNNVIIRFVNPGIAGIHMIFVFVIAISILVLLLKSDRVLYTLEIVLILNIPLILVITFQAYTNEYLTLHSILEVMTHVAEVPSWCALAASTFVFSGYANLVVFNRVFKEPFKVKHLWFIPFLGMFNLFTSVFIPVGIWGADGVGVLTFPWISTADALRVEYGPIERLVTVFILLYVSVSLVSVIIHWHVALELIKGLRTKHGEERKKTLDWIVLGFFSAVVLLMEHFFIEEDIFQFSQAWLKIRLPAEGAMVLLMFLLARRKKI